jgi:hypothetical protein
VKLHTVGMIMLWGGIIWLLAATLYKYWRYKKWGS